MAVSQVNTERPSIFVKVMPSYNGTDMFNNVLYGIEEEGIPYTIVDAKNGSHTAKSLAFEACNQSNLGVGVGIADDGISVHYEKLNQEETLFFIDTKSDLDKVRDIGSNAARIVKRMPFKKL